MKPSVNDNNISIEHFTCDFAKNAKFQILYWDIFIFGHSGHIHIIHIILFVFGHSGHIHIIHIILLKEEALFVDAYAPDREKRREHLLDDCSQPRATQCPFFVFVSNPSPHWLRSLGRDHG